MMLTAAVTLVMATTTTRAVRSGDNTDAAAAAAAKTVHSCDEPALDRKYDNCVAMLHTGTTETLNDRPRTHFYFP